MDEAARVEYEVLRATIRQRGTARIALAWATIVAWACLVVALTAWSAWPAAFLVSLVVLDAGFEAVYALHVGVERIGRYVQVFYEPPSAPAPGVPSWESAAMAYGDRYPGHGLDPLFTPLFAAATILNYLPVAVAGARVELAALGLVHAGLLVRFLVARHRAGRVRAVDLARFRDLRA